LWRVTGRQVPLSKVPQRLKVPFLYILTKTMTWGRLRGCLATCNY
jgi:hypothetical protein